VFMVCRYGRRQQPCATPPAPAGRNSHPLAIANGRFRPVFGRPTGTRRRDARSAFPVTENDRVCFVVIADPPQFFGRFGRGKGGHYAAWEQPALFSAEVRAAFRSLR
jgi:hypothetical protein